MAKWLAPYVVSLHRNSLDNLPFQYCPSCTQSLIHKLIDEVIDELSIHESSIAITPVACASFLSHNFELDVVESAQGRAPAMAIGLK